MTSFEHVDRLGLAASATLLSLFVVGFAYDSDYLITVYSPVSYVWVGLVIIVVVALPYRPFRTSWAWSVLFGAMVLTWGLHNIAAPGTSLVMGYGFAVLGTVSIAYGIYDRFVPAVVPDLPISRQ